MVKGRFGKVAVAAMLATACAFGVTACGGGSAPSNAAATINGTAISEDEITQYIESVRVQFGYTDDDSWAQYLVAVGMTPADLRQNILDSMIDQELITQYAGEKGVSIDPSEIDFYVDQMRSNFSSDEDWAAALSDAGMTEEEYRSNIEFSLVKQALNEVFASEVQVPEQELLDTASLYSMYINGSKRSSHILFSLDDRETAQNVLDRINAGELDFAEAAREYSIDSSAENGGDVGWDAMSSFVNEYQSVLDVLEVGQISALVESQFGYHIIMCTDYFVAPEEITSLDQIPEDFRDVIESAAKTQAVDAAMGEWLSEIREKATIVINEIPANAPYNVDLSKYLEPEPAADASASAESASAETASASSSSAAA